MDKQELKNIFREGHYTAGFIHEQIDKLDESEIFPQQLRNVNITISRGVEDEAIEQSKEKFEQEHSVMESVPQFVDDYFRSDYGNYFEKIGCLVEAHDGDPYCFNDLIVEEVLSEDGATKLWKWAEKQERSKLMRFVNGYEIEQEPKYYIELPRPSRPGNYYFAKIDDEIQYFVSGNVSRFKTDEKYHFTETEIKEIDERFFAFAVLVEETTE